VAILACGDSDPVTVRTKKATHLNVPSRADEIFTPKSKIKKSHRIFIIVGLLIAVLLAMALVYYFWPQIHQKLSPRKAIPKKESIQKQPLSPSKTTKPNST
jgi:flagellar basal body-associated protein FliL